MLIVISIMMFTLSAMIISISIIITIIIITISRSSSLVSSFCWCTTRWERPRVGQEEE